MPETLLTSIDRGVMTITLHRPDRMNAFNEVMMEELIEAYKQADDNDEVRVVIVTGSGRAFCAGMDLTSGDDVFASEESVGLPETGLGLIPGYGGTQRLTRLVGVGRAKELIFTGRYVNSDEALTLGIVEKVVETGKALEEAINMANTMVKKAPLAIKAAKQAIQQGIDRSLKEGIEIEVGLCGNLFGTQDLQEGATAFFDRREAKFIGS